MIRSQICCNVIKSPVPFLPTIFSLSRGRRRNPLTSFYLFPKKKLLFILFRMRRRVGLLCFQIIAAVLGHWNMHDSNGCCKLCGWRLDASQ